MRFSGSTVNGDEAAMSHVVAAMVGDEAMVGGEAAGWAAVWREWVAMRQRCSVMVQRRTASRVR
jgi:hypothetical protein